MKKSLILLIVSLITTALFCQERPKLIVGIVVDQMRYDYIYRFWDDFSNDGFKKLINEGHFFRNCQFGYVPTYTGPGHASIYTGTTPSVHGIVANDWYDKKSGKHIYCAGDGDMHTICNCEENNIDVQSEDGKMSPHHMATTTFGDELKLFNENSKVFGISLKDRGAILPAGHSADGAYWMDSEGKWITSSFYMQALPNYIQNINETNPAQNYLKGMWEVKGLFNHNLIDKYNLKGVSAIKNTPFGNTILKELALEIIEKEDLGQRKETDVLTISFSSTDYIGHEFGPHAPEIKDTYTRLDKDIAEILKIIDSKIGSENVLLFITADHGVVSEPSELLERNIPAGYFDQKEMISDLLEHLSDRYKSEKLTASQYILNYSNNNLFLNHEYILNNLNVSIEDVQRECANFLLKYKWVKNTYTATQLHENEYSNSFHSLIQNGYNQKRSGDVIVSLQTGWLKSYWENGGTTHGSSYSYDTHVPLIFWGGKIPNGKTDRKVNIRDIAPTISTILGISYPNGTTGNPLPEITE